jgi:hypothetical protein
VKRNICFAIPLFILIVFSGCKKNDSNPVAASVAATEEWRGITDNDSTNHGQLTYKKSLDGSIAVNGTWQYPYQGTTVQFVISSGTATIVDTAISITVQGTATNPAAPVGFQTSAFTESISGSAYNGKSVGTYTVTFSTFGWPSNLQGIFTATRISGSGVTK